MLDWHRSHSVQVVLAAEALDCLYASIKQGGAVVEEQEAVVTVDRKNKIVVAESGAEYQYDKLIVCCGPWTNQVTQSQHTVIVTHS